MKLNKMYMADTGASGGILFDYAQVDSALTSIEANIRNAMDALSQKITVVSYSGAAQGFVESKVNEIRTALAQIEGPLNGLKSKIDEVRAGYAKAEASIKSGLGGGESTTGGRGNNIDMTQ